MITLPVGRKRSLALVESLKPGDVIAAVTQRDPKVVDPGRSELYDIGTFVRVIEVSRTGTGEYRLALEGLNRLALDSVSEGGSFWLAEGTVLTDENADAEEALLLADSLREHVQELVTKGGGALAQVALSAAEPGVFADQVASALGMSTERELSVLTERDVPARLRLVARLLAEAKAAAEVKQKIDSDVRQEIGRGQREALLREQLKAIHRELGDSKDEGDLGARAVSTRLASRKRGRRRSRARAAVEPEPAASGVQRRPHLPRIANLPWARCRRKDDARLQEARRRSPGLDEREKANSRAHGGAQADRSGAREHPLPRRAAELGDVARPIDCRRDWAFVRISTGGVRDGPEIRGHRAPTSCAPGRILHALKKAKARNPIILLDEVDKLGVGWMGSPEAALLEVLDPEQNKTFTDHYLEIPFDLSEVLFICTANDLSTLSPPLRDRLEIIELSGYTSDEKLHRRITLIRSARGPRDSDRATITPTVVAVTRLHPASQRRQLNRGSPSCAALAQVARATDRSRTSCT
jgi:ATP-dependent Lon protease